MAKYKIGLVDVLMGNVAGDGGMGISLVAVGNTVADSPAFSTTDPTKQDFNIEEQDSAVYSITTLPGKESFAWSCYNVDAQTMFRLFGGTVIAALVNKIATLGSIVPGSGYTNGTYTGKSLTGGTGSGAIANIIVSGGAITSVTITTPGVGYTVADSLTASGLGAGTGFSVPVATLASSEELWQAPDQMPELEQSIKLVWKNGGYMEIPRAKVTSKLAFSFKKTALSQIDIVADILQPTKAGTPSKTIHYTT